MCDTSVPLIRTQFKFSNVSGYQSPPLFVVLGLRDLCPRHYYYYCKQTDQSTYQSIGSTRELKNNQVYNHEHSYTVTLFGTFAYLKVVQEKGTVAFHSNDQRLLAQLSNSVFASYIQNWTKILRLLILNRNVIVVMTYNLACLILSNLIPSSLIPTLLSILFC